MILKTFRVSVASIVSSIVLRRGGEMQTCEREASVNVDPWQHGPQSMSDVHPVINA